MSHTARHARTTHAAPASRVPARILGLAAVAGLGLAAAPAHAVTPPHAAPVADAVATADDALPAADGGFDLPAQGTPKAHMGDVRLYPLAGTPFDLLSNNVRVPVGGMDLSTFPITAPFRNGLPLGELPVVGKLLP